MTQPPQKIETQFVYLDPFLLDRARLDLGLSRKNLSGHRDLRLSVNTLLEAFNGAGLQPGTAKRIADFFECEVVDLLAPWDPRYVRPPEPPGPWSGAPEWEATGYLDQGRLAPNGLYYIVCRMQHRHTAAKQGRGKFEQFSRERPFLAPAQSLRQLCQLLLAEPDAVVAEWRQRILAGVGPDAGALFEVVPELERLLGPQSPPPELGPIEAQVRLRTLLVALVRQVAAPAHPLVLFLDDLQWADQPSLDFIGALLQEPALNGVLLIGAYRDNEVDAAHPLSRLLRQPTATGEPATVLALSSLAEGDLADLLADMLHMPREAVQSLAATLYAKTSGNPFFAIGFLEAIYREGTLRPDPERGRWLWDADAIAARPASANLVDLLVARLAESASDTAEALVAAACLGNTCTLGLLAVATGTDAGALVDRLTPAMECGMIVTPSASAFQQADANAQIRFCHDRMQQAVYQLRDDAWRGGLHLAMARRFAQAGDDPARQFSAAEHYATAAPLIVDTDERALARELFLSGAVQARQSGAFATAERFLRLGIEMLADSGHEREGSDIWKNYPGSAFAFHAELHQVLYCQSRYTEADQVYALLDANADSPFQLVAPAGVQIASLSNRTDFDGAIRLGCALLSQLGIVMPLDNPLLNLQRELDLFYQHAASAALDRLPSRSASAAPRLNSAAKLMSRLCTAAFYSQPLVGGWMAVRCGRQWIETGYEEASIYAVACISLVTIAMRGDYAIAYRVASQGLSIGLAHERGTETARAQHVMGLGISHWFRPLEEDLEYARAAFDGLLRGGDLEFACLTFGVSQAALLDTCADLASMNAETDLAIGFARKHGNHHAEQLYLSFRQLVRALAGQTAAPGSFDDAEFHEPAHLAAAQGNPMAMCYFHIYRALVAVMFQDDAALLRHAETAASLTLHITGFYPTALANLLHSLALIQQIRAGGDGQRPALLERLASNQIWLAARAADAPMNFSHLHDLVEAERLDVLDQPWESLQTFEQAMRKAQAHQRPWQHALITERAGQCCMRRGLEYAGRTLLTRAHGLYQQWGAQGKARAMRDNWAFLDASLHGGASGSLGDELNHQAVLLASRTLASERSLPRLVSRVIELVGQLTGATDVRLNLLDDGGNWWLEGGMRGTKPLPRMMLREAEERHLIATSGWRLAIKTLQPLVSEDAVIDSRFAGDPYFAGLPLCSLLGLPMLLRGRVIAFLVLENRLLRGAFTAARVETVTMLCEQLAISLENARLYQSLEAKVAERTGELSQAHNQLQSLIASMDDLVFVVDLDLRFQEFHQPAGHGFFANLEQFVGKRLEEIGLPEPALDSIHQAVRETLQTGNSAEAVYRLDSPAGPAWFEMHVTALQNSGGGRRSVTCVARDITGRKRAEAELRESEARRREQAVLLESERKYRILFDSANDAIFLHDKQARSLAVNPVACQRLGYTHAELMSMTIDQLGTPEESQHMPDRMSRLLERGQLVFETVQRHKNDSRIPTEVSSRTIIWEGQPAVLSICRDITDRKQAEVVLVEANRQLEASMVRAQELTAQAQAANAAKSRFLATMNHETRTPLNAILGFSQLLERDPTLAIDHKSRVATINRSGEHLLTLLNDILEFSKNQDGQQASVSSPFDLPFLLRDLERVFRPQTDAKQLTLRMDGLDEVERYLIADERKLRRILTNLLGNAVKFTTTGGIWVRASTEPQGTDGLRLVVLVGDSGPGIATEEIGRLFAAFEQGEVGKRSCLGTGLGLAISRQLARLMGGDVIVRSEVGQGSVFRLEILAQRATESMVEVKFEGSQVQSGLDGVHAPASQPDGLTAKGPQALTREMLDSLPAELRTRLHTAALSGRQLQLRKMLQQVADPELRKQLEKLVAKFDYAPFLELLR